METRATSRTPDPYNTSTPALPPQTSHNFHPPPPPGIHRPEIQVPHRRLIPVPRFLRELGLRPRPRAGGGVDLEGGEIGLRDMVEGIVGLGEGDGG